MVFKLKNGQKAHVAGAEAHVGEPGGQLACLGQEYRRRIDADDGCDARPPREHRVIVPVPQPTSSTQVLSGQSIQAWQVSRILL